MGTTTSQDDPPLAVCSMRSVRKRSSNKPMSQARYHSTCKRRLADDYVVDGNVMAPSNSHSSVMEATSRISGRMCALKAFRKEVMTEQQLRLMTAETEIYLTLDHPHIARLYEVYLNDDSVNMVMEFCSGGDLFYELTQRRIFTDQEAAEVTRQLLSAVCYLHSHHVVHRDLKLENLVFADADKNILKIIDFGFAVVWRGPEKMQAACGSPDYVSPEVLEGSGYTNKCDMWSVGVIVFMLLTGHAPIHSQHHETLEAKILRGLVDWSPLARPGTVSQEAESFLMSLLTLDQDARMDPTTALCHPWLVRTREKSHSQGMKNITPSVVHSLLRYTRALPLRRVALQLVTQQLLGQREVRELTELFLALADSSTGTIHLQQMEDVINHEMQLLEAGEVVDMNQEGWCYCLDANQDGQIYFSEFIAATVSSLGKLPEQALCTAFSRLDIGRRGEVGEEDLWAVLGDAVEGAEPGALLRDARRVGHIKGEFIDFEAFKGLVLRDRKRDGATGSNHPKAEAPRTPVGRSSEGGLTASTEPPLDEESSECRSEEPPKGRGSEAPPKLQESREEAATVAVAFAAAELNCEEKSTCKEWYGPNAGAKRGTKSAGLARGRPGPGPPQHRGAGHPEPHGRAPPLDRLKRLHWDSLNPWEWALLRVTEVAGATVP